MFMVTSCTHEAKFKQVRRLGVWIWVWCQPCKRDVVWVKGASQP